MMNRCIVITTTFNVFNWNIAQITDEWIHYRMSIYMKYTLRSLIKQTNQNFISFVQYSDQSESLVKQALACFGKLPGNVAFVRQSEWGKKMKDHIKSYDELFVVRLDSDDMYHKSFVQQLHDCKPKQETEVIINQEGYVYDVASHSLLFEHHFSPPFYTLIYNTKQYLNGKRIKLPGGHAGAVQLPHELIRKKNYVRIVHEKNTLQKFVMHNKKLGDLRWYSDKCEEDPKKVTDILADFM